MNGQKYETISELNVCLTKYLAAYRQSCRFCGNIITGIDICSGLLGSIAILATVPAIPVFISAIGLVIAVVHFFTK